MYPALVLCQITLSQKVSGGLVVTLVTAIPHSFMLGLLVSGQTILLSSFVFTLVTAIPHSFMLSLLVSGQTTIFSSFVVTLVTGIPNAFMHGLLVFGQICRTIVRPGEEDDCRGQETCARRRGS
jgi:hypothetical protein